MDLLAPVRAAADRRRRRHHQRRRRRPAGRVRRTDRRAGHPDPDGLGHHPGHRPCRRCPSRVSRMAPCSSCISRSLSVFVPALGRCCECCGFLGFFPLLPTGERVAEAGRRIGRAGQQTCEFVPARLDAALRNTYSDQSAHGDPSNGFEGGLTRTPPAPPDRLAVPLWPPRWSWSLQAGSTVGDGCQLESPSGRNGRDSGECRAAAP